MAVSGELRYLGSPAPRMRPPNPTTRARGSWVGNNKRPRKRGAGVPSSRLITRPASSNTSSRSPKLFIASSNALPVGAYPRPRGSTVSRSSPRDPRYWRATSASGLSRSCRANHSHAVAALVGGREAEALHAGVGGEDLVHQLAYRARALAVDDAEVRQIGRDGIVQRLDEHRLGFVQAEAAQRDLGGGNGGGQAVGRSGDLRRFAARPFKVFERHPPLLLSPFPGPFTGLFTGRFPRRLFDRLFQEPPRLPRRRFRHRRLSAPLRL